MTSREIVDLTHVLDKTVLTCTGHPSFCCESVTTMDSYGSIVSSIRMGSHTGTHLDAPYHFFPDGRTVEEIPIAQCVGPALVIDVSGKGPRERILWDDIAHCERHMAPGVVVLFRTGWSRHWGSAEYFEHPFLDAAAIARVMATGVRAIGLDVLSPDETSLEGTFGGQNT